jgi:putative transposase
MASRRLFLAQSSFWGDQVGPNPTDRGKNGTKTSILVDGKGGPLAVTLAPANVHDSQLLEETLDSIIVDRPDSSPIHEHLCLDKAYDSLEIDWKLLKRGYIPHVRRIGEAKEDEKQPKRYPARRWVVERTWAWLNDFRGLLIRYEKKACNHLGFYHLACALTWFRRYASSAF